MTINKFEKRALMAAVAFVMLSLSLVAYATWGLGINVASCIPLGTKPFEEASVTKHDGNHYEVHYVSRMWAFEPNVLRVPTGSTLDIYAMSKDVTHGLEIAGTNVNLMVVPGAVANGRVTFNKPGIYTMVCHEFCGKGHQNMYGRIEVVDGLADFTAEGLPSSPGMKLLDAKGCLACHSIDGSASVGPTFQGAYGSTIKLANGTTRVFDHQFFAEIIKNPNDFVMDGYGPIMPQIEVTPDEMKQMEEYLKELKK
jgi:cytochrome c oxidase subunit 2